MTLFNDPENLIKSGFPNEIFKISHNLPDNSLFHLDNLVELAKSLPSEQIEWNAGDASISQDPTKTPANGLSPEETVRNIEQCKSWLVLKNIQSDERYNEVLRECLNEVEEITGTRVTGVSDHAGFVFISSPQSVTPFHMDPEHNFLLQLRGSKTLQVFDQRDRSIIAEQQIENTYYGTKPHRNLEFNDSQSKKGKTITIDQGEAIHIPIHAPHWVKNGNAVSISFSITFSSDQSRKAVRVHSLNARLRSKGISPRDVGRSPLVDNTKDLAMRAAIGVKRALNREA